MEYIKLVDCSDRLDNVQFKALYLSKLAYVERTLIYLDSIGVYCTVTFHGEIVGKKLSTHIEIECADPAFKQVLSEATKSFNLKL